MAMTLRPSRRETLRALLAASGAALYGAAPSRGATGAVPRRFCEIKLEGGWDSAFATDPVVGSKRGSGGYESVYQSSDLAPDRVPGKPALVVGPGLLPARNAFARMPTAFVNGVFMEVSSHDFAAQYMSSGRLSLSNSRDFPSIPALLGAASAVFPPHVVVGAPAPLGDTRFTTPPLYSPSIEALDSMVGGPSDAILPPGPLQEKFDPRWLDEAHALIERLDDLVVGGLPASYQADLGVWRESSAQLEDIYALGLGGKLAPTVEDEIRYGAPAPGSLTADPERQLAALYLLLRSDLCPYLTISFASFDTHSDHLAVHLPLMQRFARALDVFVADLAATPDPAAPHLTLADTTTLLVTSEFVRTPTFSSTGGTEHWQSASVILMGSGVRDGVVLGATADDATALGWDLGAGGVASDRLLPDHLVAAILESFGAHEAAASVSTSRLSGLFHD